MTVHTNRKRGQEHHLWKGDKVQSVALHDWVRRYKGRPTLFPTNAEISKQFNLDMKKYISEVAIIRFDIFADSPDTTSPTALNNQADNPNSGGTK